MGSQLAREVSEHWGHLPAGPYKLLMRMALYSLDTSTRPEHPAGQYWMGWAHLSRALGRTPPADHDTSDKAARERKWMKEEVRRSTAVLVAEGAVKKAVDNPGRGTRQVWKLTV